MMVVLPIHHVSFLALLYLILFNLATKLNQETFADFVQPT